MRRSTGPGHVGSYTFRRPLTSSKSDLFLTLNNGWISSLVAEPRDRAARPDAALNCAREKGLQTYGGNHELGPRRATQLLHGAPFGRHA